MYLPSWTAICGIILFSIAIVLPSVNVSSAAPITVDFSTCQPSQYLTSPNPGSPLVTVSCCPIQPTKPAIDGLPSPSTNFLRVRYASQCTDAGYAAKLARAYELMRALPDDDPRSFTQQWFLHCSYCGGAFQTPTSGGNTTGIDIHFSWLFLPWHRLFLFFHERILQNLLGDPTFSLNFWNWDSPYNVTNGVTPGACLTAGQDFPAVLYGDATQSTFTFDPNRSANALGEGRLQFPDFTFSPLLPAVQQPLYNASADELIASNMNVMYQAMVSGGTTTSTFMGRPYRAGDLRGSPDATGGSGTLEASAHAGVHFWTGKDPPENVDMGVLAFSARDPVFFAHHSNIDRLFEVWKELGPLLNQSRTYYSDPDFLNASFMFYDENKDLRRVYVYEALDTKNMGYIYQGANDAAWIFVNQSRCSNLTYEQMITEADAIPAPVPDSTGTYHLVAGTPFVIIIDRPTNPNGLEEFLIIKGIQLNRMLNAGFDVFVNLVNPEEYNGPWKCAEYGGRFTNMAMSGSMVPGQTFVWQTSISKTLMDIKAAAPPAKVVITLVPMSLKGQDETITFTSIGITTSST